MTGLWWMIAVLRMAVIPVLLFFVLEHYVIKHKKEVLPAAISAFWKGALLTFAVMLVMQFYPRIVYESERELTPEEKEIVLSVARAKPGKLRFPVAYTEVDSIEGKHIVLTLHYYLGGTATYQHDGAMYECIDPLWT